MAGQLAAQNALAANIGNSGATMVGGDGLEEIQLQFAMSDDIAYTILGPDNSRITGTMAQAGCKLYVLDRVEGSDQPQRIIFVGGLENTPIAQRILNDHQHEAYMNLGNFEPRNF